MEDIVNKVFFNLISLCLRFLFIYHIVILTVLLRYLLSHLNSSYIHFIAHVKGFKEQSNDDIAIMLISTVYLSSRASPRHFTVLANSNKKHLEQGSLSGRRKKKIPPFSPGLSEVNGVKYLKDGLII